MNRAEKRRKMKLAKKAVRNAKLGKATNRSPGQQTLPIQESLNLAVRHHIAGDLPKAEGIYQQILQTDPRHPIALHLLGVIANQEGKYDIAVDLITRALAIKPDYADAHCNLGGALNDLGKFDEAVASCHKALAIKPNFAEAHCNLGIALKNLGRLDEAIASYLKALAVKPNFAKAHNNLGNALKNLGRLDEAVASYHKALDFNPDYAEAFQGLGNALQDLGELDEAVASYHKALDFKPDYAEALSNLGTLQLSLGEFQNGWGNYNNRWSRDDFAAWKKEYDKPLWEGQTLHGKSLLVWEEQGVGERVIFASMIPDLIELGADIYLECEKRLVPLFSRSFPTITCANMDDPDMGNAEDTKFDLHAPLGNAGRWLRADLASFPARPPYLVADSQQRQTLRNRYLERGNDVLVGIAWYSKSRIYSVRKSMTLHDLRQLLEMPGITFIDLQYGDTSEERKAFTAETGIEVFHDDGVDQLADLDIFASQVAAMDMVVTISNTTAHMAGALGVPTLLMLETAPIWYWMLERENCPWYPSLRLFRQQERGAWKGVVEGVCKDLSTRVGGC